jgi:hypothetical protein
VLVVILAVFIALVCGGHGMSAAISAIAACGLLAEEISRRLGWITGPQSA